MEGETKMTGIYVEDYYDTNNGEWRLKCSLRNYEYLIRPTEKGNIPLSTLRLARRVLELRIRDDEQQKLAKIGTSIDEPERVRDWNIFRS